MKTFEMRKIILVSILVFSAACKADYGLDESDCIQPKILKGFFFDGEEEHFLARVKSYKECMGYVIRGHDNSIEIHQELKKRAVQELDGFMQKINQKK
jgi:hypothetical protein